MSARRAPVSFAKFPHATIVRPDGSNTHGTLHRGTPAIRSREQPQERARQRDQRASSGPIIGVTAESTLVDDEADAQKTSEAREPVGAGAHLAKSRQPIEAEI